MSSQSLVPSLLSRYELSRLDRRLAVEFLAWALGVGLLCALAQVVIPLPWTPVPITGQTFGVALTALLWGRRRSMWVMGGYLVLGAAGLPVFAAGGAFIVGASSGYLAGMLLASFVVGGLADRGFTRSWSRAFLAAACGSVVTFSCGLLVLSFFVPREALLAAGLWPFLAGDFLKNSAAAWLAVQAQRLK